MTLPTPEEILRDCDLLAPAGDATTTRLNSVPILRVVKAARAWALAQTNPPTPADLEAREVVARWMMEHSYATGHGDTIADLLVELEGQARSRAAPAGAQDGVAGESEAHRRFEIRRLLVELLCEHCDELMDNQADRIMHKVVHPLLAENAGLKEEAAGACFEYARAERAEADANRLAEATRAWMALRIDPIRWGPAKAWIDRKKEVLELVSSALAEHDKAQQP